MKEGEPVMTVVSYFLRVSNTLAGSHVVKLGIKMHRDPTYVQWYTMTS